MTIPDSFSQNLNNSKTNKTTNNKNENNLTLNSVTNIPLLDNLLEGCQILSNELEYLYINNSATAHSGLTKNDFIGNKITDVWPSFNKTELYKIMQNCLSDGIPKRFETHFSFPDGKISWYDLSIQKIPEGLFILSIDISEKKKIEKILLDRNKKFQIVFESANVAKSITQLSGKLEVNKAFCDMLGYTKKELENKNWQEITPQEDIPYIEKKLEAIVKGDKSSIRFNKRYIHKKGYYLCVDISLVLYRDEDNNPLFFIATIIDISKQKKAEQLVLYQKELLEEMGKIAKIGAWEFDPATGKGTWTDEVARIHDLEPGRKTNVELGLSFYEKKSLIKIEKAIKEAVDNKKPYELELKLISAKGNKKWIRTHGKPIIENDKVINVRGSFQDITEWKNMEEKIKNNETMLKTLMGNLPGVAYRCRNNKNWEMEYLSEGCYQLTGYDPSELIGNTNKSYNELIHPEDQDMIWTKVQIAIQNNTSFELEYRIITKNQEIKWVWEQGKKISNSYPNVLEGFISDITDRKLAQLALIESEERFAKTFRSSPAGMIISLAHNNIYIDVNETFAQIVGYKPEEIIGYNYKELGFLSNSEIKKITNEYKKNETIRNIEIQLNCKKKKKTVLFSNEQIELNGNLCIISTIIDITDRKIATQALSENEKRLKNAQHIAKIGDYIWNIKKDQINFSGSLKNILGYAKAEIFNLEYVRKHIHHPDDSEKIMNWMQNNLKSSKSILTPFEYRVLKKDGSTIYIRALGIVKRNNNKVTHILATIQDITEQKLAELEIKKLNQELEKRVKERTEQLESINKELKTFTYSVSHDLKAPLRGIDGYSKLLHDSFYNILNEEGKYFLSSIREGTLQMNQLIDDLLTYSRLERNALNIKEIHFNELIEKLVKSYQKEINEKQITINSNVDDLTIFADYNSISMALRNLLDNAIKFTKEKSKPEISIGYLKKNGTTTLFVKDNGIGFDPKYQNKIFEIFHRLQRIEDYPGTGIGLALVHKAMNRLGGRVYADSKPGKGAIFYLELKQYFV